MYHAIRTFLIEECWHIPNSIKNSGFDGTITCNDQSEQAKNVKTDKANQARIRKGAIIW